MRITTSMLLRNALTDVNRQRTRLAQTQEKASSGLAINRPSDDPVGASAALLLRAGVDATQQYQRNVTQARNRVAVLESAIGTGIDVLIDAKVVADAGATATDPGSRLILAAEVESLHERLLAEANTRSSQAYVFGGFSTGAPPFVASGPFVTGGPSPTVAFVGDSSEMATPIDDGISATTTLDGRRVFMGDADGDGSPDANREDLFVLLTDLRDALVADDQAAVQATRSRFETALAQLNTERTHVGTTDVKLSDWQQRLSERDLQLQTRLSNVQDADAAQVFSDLVHQENALRAALDTTTRLMQPSLLDFLG
jgi:flagellar hook-associated protein 3 FlgL